MRGAQWDRGTTLHIMFGHASTLHRFCFGEQIYPKCIKKQIKEKITKTFEILIRVSGRGGGVVRQL